MGDHPLAPTPLPPVQRLSRAVLLVAAGLVTVTLLAVAFLATPQAPDRPQSLVRPSAGGGAGNPGFLLRPPANPPAASPEITEQEYLKRLWAGFGPGAPGFSGARGNRGGPRDPGDLGATGEPGQPGESSGGRQARPVAPGPLPDPAPAGADAWADLGDAGMAGNAGAGNAAGAGGAAAAIDARGFSRGAGGLFPAPEAPPSPQRDLRREAFLRALHAPLALAAAPTPPRAASPWPPLPAPEALGIQGFAGPDRAVVEPRHDAGFLTGRAAEASAPLLAGERRLALEAPAAERRRGDSSAAPANPTAPATAFGDPAALAGRGNGANLYGSDTESAALLAFSPGGTGAPAALPGGPAALPGGTAALSDGTAALPTSAASLQARAVPLPAGTAVLPAGTVVPALLITAVNSDLPGPLLAQVSRDVYDLLQRAVVLPRGTRLLGRYGNQVAVGQQRLLVAWTRLQLLDGTLVDLPGLPGASSADAGGAAGLPAQVQNHLLRVFGDAILLSLLAAGADLSQPGSTSALAAPSAGSVAAAALGQQLSAAGTQLLRRDLAIQPTLTLPAGTPLTVFVNADLPLPALPAPPTRQPSLPSPRP